MRPTVPRLAGILTTAALAGLLALPAGAAATTNEPIAQTGGMTATLPLFGTTLTVDVALDTTGNISGVVLTPPGDFTQTTTEATKVKFENTAGTTTVSVKAKGSTMSIKASSGALADVSGTDSWGADIFGTGAKSTVAYTIGDDGTGKPTLAIGAISAAAGIVATPIAPKSHSDEDEDASVSGGATFAFEGYVKRLSISVSVDRESGKARLQITLSGKDRQRTTGTLAELAGPRTWSAHLCDGTAVTVTYHVGPGGSAVYDSATGAPATAKKYDHGFQADFDGTNVGVKVALKANEDGAYTVMASGFSGSCGKDGSHDDSKGSGSGSGSTRPSGGGSSGSNGSGGSHGSSNGSGDDRSGGSRDGRG